MNNFQTDISMLLTLLQKLKLYYHKMNKDLKLLIIKLSHFYSFEMIFSRLNLIGYLLWTQLSSLSNDWSRIMLLSFLSLSTCFILGSYSS